MNILYEDNALVALDTPAGLYSEEGVPAALRQHWDTPDAFVGVVQRLDTGVSGLKVFARTPERLVRGRAVPQGTKIFLKLREMGGDVPADVYTIPYAVKTLLEAKSRRDDGESLVLHRSTAQKGGAV